MMKLRSQMNHYNTSDSLSDTFNTVLTEWMDTGTVEHSKYPVSHQDAIFDQYRIGWEHLFTGHLSQEWEKLQGDQEINGRVIKATDWASSVVTTILQHVIQLWEQRNSDVHGKTSEEQTNRLLTRQKATISRLLDLKPKCLARDHFLFPSNSETLMQETSTTRLSNWISTRTKAIKNSIAQALKQDVQNTRPITTWLRTTANKTMSQAVQWKQDRLLHDPYNKKKKHKDASTANRRTIQTMITNHLK